MAEQQDIISSHPYLPSGDAFLFPYGAIRIFYQAMLSLILLCHKAIKGCSARQNRAKKRSLHGVNEHFEPDFNAAMRPSAFCDTVRLNPDCPLGHKTPVLNGFLMESIRDFPYFSMGCCSNEQSGLK
ncbi:MAG: hypothetical protein HY936_06855 [Nitrosomonadales bacterium]|nr:hypothetical protein [Nitrosomonadales bacterium]